MFKISKSFNLDTEMQKMLQAPKITNLFGNSKIATASDNSNSIKNLLMNLVSISDRLDFLNKGKESTIFAKIAQELSDSVEQDPEDLTDISGDSDLCDICHYNHLTDMIDEETRDEIIFDHIQDENLDGLETDDVLKFLQNPENKDKLSDKKLNFATNVLRENEGTIGHSSQDVLDRFQRDSRSPEDIPHEHLLYEEHDPEDQWFYDEQINPEIYGQRTKEDDLREKELEEELKEMRSEHRAQKMNSIRNNLQYYDESDPEKPLFGYRKYFEDFDKNHGNDENKMPLSFDEWYRTRWFTNSFASTKKAQLSDENFLEKNDLPIDYETCGTCGFDHSYDINYDSPYSDENYITSLKKHIEDGELHGFPKDLVIEFLENHLYDFTEEQIENTIELIKNSPGDEISA